MQMRSLAVVVLAGLLAAGTAHAQNALAGKQIAKTWCSHCHLVDPQEQKTASDAVPAFVSIARMQSTTPEFLAAFLSKPHGQMPDFSLTRIQIKDVSAYIISLRKSP